MVIKHRDVEFETLVKICELKNTHWVYSIESQLEWIRENVKPYDLHIWLFDETGLISYAQLSRIVFTIDNVLLTGFGIGNVIVRDKGKRYGTELMMEVKGYIHAGLLFCKPSLIPFYSKCGWNVVDQKNYYLKFKREGIVLMTYNLGTFDLLRFDGTEF